MNQDAYREARAGMVRTQIANRGITDSRVQRAMLDVPRHEFVAEELWSSAYEDHPLPIGAGQTISQPYIVALMLRHLALEPTDRVLEVGTGSGYVTALLSRMCAEVFSIERHQELAEGAIHVLERLGYTNVRSMVADGTLGWPEAAPFNKILVSAAASEVPPLLVDQMTDGARMVVPVGFPSTQQLHLIHKLGGTTTVQHFEGCRFVPLVNDQRP